MTLALLVPGSAPENPAVIAATIRLEKLLRLANRSKVFETFVVDDQGLLLAHSDSAEVTGKATLDWIAQLEGVTASQSFGGTSEYSKDGVDMVAGIAKVNIGGLLSGVQIPKNAAYLTARELLGDLMWVAFGLLIGAVLLSFFVAQRMTRPIERLSLATRQMAGGDFDVLLQAESNDEIGSLTSSFNQMAADIKSAQVALVQSEKMAAFGQLGAGIAHEVKNPLGGILGLTQLCLRKAEKESQLEKNLKIIEKETKRCKEIVENLLKFARQEKVAFGPFDINQVAEDASAIVAHQLSINQVKMKKEFATDLPKVVCNPNQIQQVLINFLINAQQAMEGNPGSVTLSTRAAGADQIQVLVSDTGPGMSKEVQAKIFEPFFTTKAAGKGTGLGLSVTYGIIQEHKGSITVESEPGQGASFILTFPTVGSANAPATRYEIPSEAT
jgi:signal transduction histidine kinase